MDLIKNIDVEKILKTVVKILNIKIDRKNFLKKELKIYCLEKQINNVLLRISQKVKVDRYCISFYFWRNCLCS